MVKMLNSGSGGVAQLVRVLSQYAQVVGSTRGQGIYKNQPMSPGWCGSVDWVLDCELKRVADLFPVGAHAWVVGLVPSGGHMRGNHALMLLSLSFSFLSPLYKNK